jgi:hypothetical protein
MVMATVIKEMPIHVIFRSMLVSLRKVCRRLHVTTTMYNIENSESVVKDRMYFGSFIKTNLCILASQVYGEENVLVKPARKGNV